MKLILLHGSPGVGDVELLCLKAASYFRDVEAHLERTFANLDVIVPTLPRGPLQARADFLANLIRSIGEVRIIAHSAGGVDARFVASSNGSGLGHLVKGIATVCSPHRGSRIADGLTNPLLAPLVLAPVRHLAEAVREFTSDEMKRFNAAHPETPGVSYFYYGASTSPARLVSQFSFFLPFFNHIKGSPGPAGGENDGWVSLESAAPQDKSLTDTFEGDHATVLGWNLKAGLPVPFDGHLPFWEGVAARLGAERAAGV